MFHRMGTLSFSVTDLHGFMLILSFLHLNAKLFTDLPVHVCRCLVVAVYVLSFSSGQPEFRWPMVSSKRTHSLHFGSAFLVSKLGGVDLGLR